MILQNSSFAGLNQLFSPAPPPYTARNMTQEPPVTLEVTLGQPITYNLGDVGPKGGPLSITLSLRKLLFKYMRIVNLN